MKFFKSKKERTTRTNQRTANEKNKKNKMLVLRKRQVAAVSLILLIGIAGYLNMTIRKGEADPDVSVMYTEASKKLGEAKMVNSTETEENKEVGQKQQCSSWRGLFHQRKNGTGEKEKRVHRNAYRRFKLLRGGQRIER